MDEEYYRKMFQTIRAMVGVVCRANSVRTQNALIRRAD
jgi:hypothetical protein